MHSGRLMCICAVKDCVVKRILVIMAVVVVVVLGVLHKVVLTTDGTMAVLELDQDGVVGNAHRLEPDLTVRVAMPNGEKMSTTAVLDCAME
jgi:hypothetical protein